MFGKNKISNIVPKGGDYLDIVEIFPTIQGEGPLSGIPAIFIRLGGCNLKCKFCDTEFDNYRTLSLSQIIAQISETKVPKTKLIVITGGEPLRQPIKKLCNLLIENGYMVQVETNGTILRKLPEQVTIVCSPKIVNNSYNITNELMEYADCFKFLVESKGKYSIVPKRDFTKPVFIQPIDSYNKKTNEENMAYATDLALRNNYRLSLQIHKILNIK